MVVYVVVFIFTTTGTTFDNIYFCVAVFIMTTTKTTFRQLSVVFLRGGLVLLIPPTSIFYIILREIEKAEHGLHLALRFAPFVLLCAVGHQAAAGVEHGFFGAEVHAAQRYEEGRRRMVAGIAREAAVIAARRGNCGPARRYASRDTPRCL